MGLLLPRYCFWSLCLTVCKVKFRVQSLFERWADTQLDFWPGEGVGVILEMLFFGSQWQEQVLFKADEFERLLANTDIRDIWGGQVSHDTSARVRWIRKVSKIIVESWLAEQRSVSASGGDASFRILWWQVAGLQDWSLLSVPLCIAMYITHPGPIAREARLLLSKEPAS